MHTGIGLCCKILGRWILFSIYKRGRWILFGVHDRSSWVLSLGCVGHIDIVQ